MSRGQESTLAANAATYARLSKAIGELEHVPSAKIHQASHVKEVEGQFATIEKETAQLVRETEKKRNKHQSRQTSTVKKSFYKLFDKGETWEAKKEKAERVYNEFYQKQEIAQTEQSAVETRLREARKELKNWEQLESQLLSLKAEIPVLFSRVFDGGPTGFFPEDERLKDAIHAAEERRDEIQAKFNSESQAKEELDLAKECIDKYLFRILTAVAERDEAVAERNEAVAERNKAVKKDATGKKAAALKEEAAWKEEECVAKSRALDSEKLRCTEVVPQVEKLVRNAIRSSPLVTPITGLGAYVPTTKSQPAELLTEIFRYNRQLATERSDVQDRVEQAGKKLEQALKILDSSYQEQYNSRKATFDSYLDNSKDWDSILVIAKNNAKRHVALVHAFPEREKVEATLILTNTTEQYKVLGLEPSRDTSILIVSNEYSDFRNRMKDIAREVVKFHYKDVLFPTDFKGHEVVKRNVVGILGEGRFLRGGVDDNGKTKNLAHPSIEALALQYYYTGDTGLGNLFPGDFKDVIPDHAFALLMTCIRNCLEEYSEHGSLNGINFEGKKYREIYNTYLGVINACKEHEYHGPQFETRRAEWASKGMQQLRGDSYTSALFLD